MPPNNPDGLPEAPPKWRCAVCGWVGAEYLTAPNPFDPTEPVNGCPECKSVDQIFTACAAAGCREPGTSGGPGNLGYRYAFVCHEHWRAARDA